MKKSQYLSMLLLVIAARPAMAAVYTYDNSSASATDPWSTGVNWDDTPVGGSDTELRFIDSNTTVFGNGLAIVSNNDIAGTFSLNVLTLQGTQSTTTASSMTVQGNALQFVSNGATTPVVNLNALAPNTRLTYTVSNNLHLAADTLFTGNGTVGAASAATAGFNFSGTLSGSGGLTKTGTSKLSLGSSVVSNGLNESFLYSGDIQANGGTIQVVNNGNVYTRSRLTVATGGTFDVAGHTTVSSLSGTAGTLTGNAGSNRSLFINYAGTDSAAGFTGTIGGLLTLVGGGSGDLTFGAVGNGSSSTTLTNLGTGTMTAISVRTNNAGAGITTANPYATVKLTGTSGTINGKATSNISGGTLIIAPSGSGADVLVTGQDVQVTGSTNASQFRYSSAATLRLDKGANTSVNFQIGNSTSTSTSIVQILQRQSSVGTLILDPVSGAGTLGTTAKFTLLRGATQGNVLPQITNGMASASIVVVDNDGTRKADFVTYNGTGISTDVGFQQATYDLPNTFTGSTNLSKIKITTDQTLSGATSAYALRNDAVITLGSGVTLALGNPIAGASTATQSPTTGLILNGGTIAATDSTSILAFGASEAAIYTSTANGTIAAKITGTGAINSGMGNFSANRLISLNKFGEGTLFLTNTANTFSGALVISAGAVDVGNISSNTLAGSSASLTFNGGVLQGNGTFVRSLGDGSDQVSWNGINLTNSQKSGGFAAKGGDLVVAIGGTGSPTALTWGLASAAGVHFITETSVGAGGATGVLVFGSNTSDSQVDFRNAINLGTTSSAMFYRTIYVNKGTGTDSAKISGVISSTTPHGLIKDGAGRLVLSGNNTYAGDTVVAEGSLFIDGNTSGQGSFQVNAGATLGGGGSIGLASGQTVTVAGLADNAAHLTSGATGSGTFAIGSVGADNRVIFGDHSIFDVSLSGASASLLAVTGDLQLGGVDSSIVLTMLASASGSSYTIATYSGALTGAFADISSLTNQGFTIDYGTGFDSAITLTAVPEPASVAAVMAAAVMGVVVCRRRRTARS